LGTYKKFDRVGTYDLWVSKTVCVLYALDYEMKTTVVLKQVDDRKKTVNEKNTSTALDKTTDNIQEARDDNACDDAEEDDTEVQVPKLGVSSTSMDVDPSSVNGETELNTYMWIQLVANDTSLVGV
jgi:hypothetical protein